MLTLSFLFLLPVLSITNGLLTGSRGVASVFEAKEVMAKELLREAAQVPVVSHSASAGSIRVSLVSAHFSGFLGRFASICQGQVQKWEDSCVEHIVDCLLLI